MTNILRKNDNPEPASPADARDPNGGFKRLALPAVAAAVQTLAGAKGRSIQSPDRVTVARRDGKPT